MLFSDIEGSTVLLSRLGEAYGEALSSQRAIMRAAIAGSRGVELGTEGDSFFVVFSSAADAVRYAVAAQRALAACDWPGGAAVRVRMGLHAGEPTRHEDGYVGLDVHRAARIAAAAHGGQVVTSQVTWQLARPGLPGELSVRDLGVHRLKDIEEPERIVQLVGPGLAGEFPPLKSLGALTSLPVPSAPLVGREDDLGRLRAAARSLWEDSAAIAREIGSDVRLAVALVNLGWAEREAGNLDRAAQVLLESLAIDRKRGDIWGVVKNQQGLAMVSLRAGRVLEANDRLAARLDYVVSGNTDILIVSLELSACVVAELGDGLRAARLIGAAEAIRQTAGTPMAQRGGAFLERYLAPVRATIERGTWDAELAAGRALTREQAVALLRSPAPSHPPIPAT